MLSVSCSQWIVVSESSAIHSLGNCQFFISLRYNILPNLFHIFICKPMTKLFFIMIFTFTLQKFRAFLKSLLVLFIWLFISPNLCLPWSFHYKDVCLACEWSSVQWWFHPGIDLNCRFPFLFIIHFLDVSFSELIK